MGLNRLGKLKDETINQFRSAVGDHDIEMAKPRETRIELALDLGYLRRGGVAISYAFKKSPIAFSMI